MNRLSVWKQDDEKKLAFFLDLFPLSDSLIRLNLRIVRVFDCLFNPFHLYFSTIRPLLGIEKILCEFHLLYFRLTACGSAARGESEAAVGLMCMLAGALFINFMAMPDEAYNNLLLLPIAGVKHSIILKMQFEYTLPLTCQCFWGDGFKILHQLT